MLLDNAGLKYDIEYSPPQFVSSDDKDLPILHIPGVNMNFDEAKEWINREVGKM